MSIEARLFPVKFVLDISGLSLQFILLTNNLNIEALSLMLPLLPFPLLRAVTEE
jgi:hypothetical protein